MVIKGCICQSLLLWWDGLMCCSELFGPGLWVSMTCRNLMRFMGSLWLCNRGGLSKAEYVCGSSSAAFPIALKPVNDHGQIWQRGSGLRALAFLWMFWKWAVLSRVFHLKTLRFLLTLKIVCAQPVSLHNPLSPLLLGCASSNAAFLSPPHPATSR